MSDLYAITKLKDDVAMMEMMTDKLDDLSVSLPLANARALLRLITATAMDNASLSEELQRWRAFGNAYDVYSKVLHACDGRDTDLLLVDVEVAYAAAIGKGA